MDRRRRVRPSQNPFAWCSSGRLFGMCSARTSTCTGIALHSLGAACMTCLWCMRNVRCPRVRSGSAMRREGTVARCSCGVGVPFSDTIQSCPGRAAVRGLHAAVHHTSKRPNTKGADRFTLASCVSELATRVLVRGACSCPSCAMVQLRLLCCERRPPEFTPAR
jgi:hypothetical protein